MSVNLRGDEEEQNKHTTKIKSGIRNASYLATVAALVETHVVQAVRVDPVLEGQVVVRTGYQFLLLTYNYKIPAVPSSILVGYTTLMTHF